MKERAAGSRPDYLYELGSGAFEIPVNQFEDVLQQIAPRSVMHFCPCYVDVARFGSQEAENSTMTRDGAVVGPIQATFAGPGVNF